MKNKIIAISLALILIMSSAYAFADVQTNNFYGFYNNNSTSSGNQTAAAPSARTSSGTTTGTTSARGTASTSNSGYEQKVVQLVNAERQKNGLPSLSMSSSISGVARTKSRDMATNNYFAHQSPTYGSAGDMLKQSGIGFSAWGENIASGQRSPEAVVNAWMNSPGHRANILSPDFGKIGVGYVTNSNGTPYWTQIFTN